ncbi:hypothetical protein JHD50_05815 [Sulfurimonas sp. MAG313]|nr:hypothetical protein [Sulfurimonas sp. MAG313]MDF1880825.1 hypothetical protein [Sulfurimonas sp. MAG313]
MVYIKKGLLALLVTLSFSYCLQANFIVVDEVVKIDGFNEQIEPMGTELLEKTGVHLYLSLAKQTENNQSIIEYQRALIKTLDEPAVLFSFIEGSKQVQIYAEDKSLYTLFDREEIMDPVAIWPFFNGRVIPVITAKAPKQVPEKEKYAVAMFNGYAEIAEQIAKSKDVVLETAVGDTNKNVYKILITGMSFIVFVTILKMLYDTILARRQKRKNNV